MTTQPIHHDINNCVPALPKDVIAMWTPAFYMHREEAYWPSSMEWFMERAELFCSAEDMSPNRRKLLGEGEVTPEKLLELQAQNLGHLVVDIEPAYHPGPDPHTLNDAPVYVNVKLVCDDDGEPESYEINYMTFYPFNGWYNLCGLSCMQAGGHVGDWEHCTVRLDAGTLALEGVWYNSHRHMEGEWVAAADVPRTPGDNRIIAYVAKDGHGVYPKAGTIFRLFSIANDYTSDGGRVWRPNRAVMLCGLDHGGKVFKAISRGCALPAGPEGDPAPLPHPSGAPQVVECSSLWQRFEGRWGTSRAPPLQIWYNFPEQPVSRTPFQRLCLPCWPGVRRVNKRRNVKRDASRTASGTAVSGTAGHRARAGQLADSGIAADSASSAVFQPLPTAGKGGTLPSGGATAATAAPSNASGSSNRVSFPHHRAPLGAPPSTASPLSRPPLLVPPPPSMVRPDGTTGTASGGTAPPVSPVPALTSVAFLPPLRGRRLEPLAGASAAPPGLVVAA